MRLLYLKALSLSFSILLPVLSLMAQPTISSFSPASGPIGTTVTITGTNFSTTSTDNTVYFGAVKAAVSAATSTSLTVTVPVGTTYQPISVTTGGLTAYSASAFVITFPGAFTKFSDSSFDARIDSSISYPLVALCYADFDGDGKVDIVTSEGNSTTKSDILVYRNSSIPGKISLAAKLVYPRTNNDFFPAVVSTDVDGDGKLDMVVDDRQNYQILVYRNTSSSGTISFDNPVIVPNSFVTDGPFGMAAGDLNGDGKPDLVLGNTFTDVAVFTNTSTPGNITFTRTIFTAPGFSGTSFVSICDIDGDNKPDIIISQGGFAKFDINLTVVALINTSSSGTLSFRPAITLVGVAGEVIANGLAVGDLDGDGKPDVVVTDNFNNSVFIFKNTSSPGNPSLAAGISYPGGNSAVSITDIDGDGKPDLAICGNTGLSLYKNLSTIGAISFADKVNYLSGNSTVANGLSDIDGDGKPDLIVANASTLKLSIFRNKIGESSLKPSGANPVTGDVVKTTTVDATVQQYNGLPYVQRHYDIEPANNPATSTATVTLYFTQTDFDNFNAYPTHGYNLPTGPTDAAGISSLRVFQYHGFSTTSDPGGYSGSSVEIDPADNNIKWNAATALWEVTFDVTGFSGFFISSAASSLPLKLLSFAATLQGNNAQLKWATTSETNTSYFEVQRSTDGSSFTTIAKVNAAGNSSINLSYQYTDGLGTDPVYYYRLKMVDKDAGFTYSDIARVSSTGRQSALSLYPNPARDYVTVAHPATANDTQLKLLDMTGKVLALINVSKNSLQTNISLTGLAHGAYKIVWKNGAKTTSQTLMIE